MSQHDRTELTEEEEIEIDRIADQFEQDWREGKRPRIEELLVGRAPIRIPLLEELLRIEREMRENQGEKVTTDEYCSRFPGDEATVDAAFSVDSGGTGYNSLLEEFERIWKGENSITAEAFVRLRCSKPTRDLFLKILERETALRSERFLGVGNGGDIDSSGDSSTESLPPRFGRYEVRRLISKGGFGEVYAAVDPKLDRQVAIKTPRVDRGLDDVARREFEREAKLICRLEHQHILPIYDYGMTDAGRPYLVCKLVKAETLAHQLARRRINFYEIVRIMSAVASSLHHAHSSGVVHRDVKPRNILMEPSGHAWLTDFGLGLESPKTHLESDRSGTPLYWSPEQAQGKAHLVDGRSDIFSLGIVLYQMLTGSHPFAADSDEGVLKRIIEADVKPPRQGNDRIPKELEEICLRALRRDPTDRFSTAADMLEALEQVGTYEPAPIDTSGIEIPNELKPLLERLAINVHEIWAQKRIAEGWIVGPTRNDSKRTHPDLVPFEQLPSSEQQYDRDVVDCVIRAAIALGARITIASGDEKL